MKVKLFAILALSAVSSLAALAQAFDDNFGAMITRPGDAAAVQVLPDGRFVVAGTFSMANRVAEANVARFQSNGTIDPSFNTSVPFAVTAMAVQPDGKVVIGGTFTNSSADEGLTVLRLNADGSQDQSFQAGFIPQGSINSIAVEFNGSILVGGAFTLYDGMAVQGLIRLQANGSLQQGFVLSSTNTVFINDIVVQSNGRFVVGGTVLGGPNGPEGYLSYRTHNGLPVGNFSFSSDLPGVNNFLTSVRDITLDPLGRIVLTGSTFLIRHAVVLLNVNGSLNDWDEFFGIPMGLEVSPSGQIMLGGELETINAVHRYIPGTGVQLYSGGPGADGLLRQFAFFNDGSYLVIGRFSAFNGQPALSVKRISSQGQPVTSFGAALERPGIVQTIARYDEGRICIGGDFAMIGEQRSVNVARLMLADASYDPAFNSPPLSYRNTLNHLSVDEQGRLLLAGTNNTQGSTIGQSPLLRLLSNGQIDPSFAISPLPLGRVEQLAALPGGQVMAIGSFTVFDPGIVASNIAIYRNNGQVDEAFSDRISGQATGLIRQADGSLVLGGRNLRYDGGPLLNMLRLLPNMELDPDFAQPADFACMSSCRLAFAEQADGRLLMGGQFALGPDSCLARLMPDGLQDDSFALPGFFSPAPGFRNGAPQYLGLMADESLLTVGPVDSIGDMPINSMVLLDRDGELMLPLDEEAFATQRLLTALVLDESTFLIGGIISDPSRPGQFGLAKASLGLDVRADLQGRITTEAGLPIVAVEVQLSGADNRTVLTDANGAFAFTQLIPGEGYTVRPMLDVDPVNGVSTLDLILLNRHILGVQALTSPYKRLAADVNNSASISLIDMIGIRKAILGQTVGISTSPSWRFVRADYVFANPQLPWQGNVPATYTIDALPEAGVDDADFIGIKMGDINGDADTGG